MGNGIIRPPSPSLNGVSACVSLCTHACTGIKLELISFRFSEQEVRIHGLGAAINRAINLALQLEQRGQGTVEVYNIKNLNLTNPTMAFQGQWKQTKKQIFATCTRQTSWLFAS